jgi:hypothetical protein
MTHLDPQSERRLQQLNTLLRAWLCKSGPNAELILRIWKRNGVVSRNSRVERLVTESIDSEEASGA